MKSYLTQEVQQRLDMSESETSELTVRDLRCPNCKFLVDKLYSDISGHIQIKCPKCKNVYILNVAYFRTFGSKEPRTYKVTFRKIN